MLEEGVAGGWGLGGGGGPWDGEGGEWHGVMGGGEGGGVSGCQGQACVSWESWVLHLNQHMLRPSGGCVNAHGDRWPRP